MVDIEPTIDKRQMLCAETQGAPCALVVFGASGDLAQRKLIPSLYGLYRRQLLSDKFYFIGYGRKELADEQFRDVVADAIKGEGDSSQQAAFCRRFYFISGNYDDPELYSRLSKRLDELDAEHQVRGCRIFYLSVPPMLYPEISSLLGKAGLSSTSSCECESCPRLVVEKPFGRDLKSAVELDERLHEYFDESQIYRIDHYLGKETVQNILMFRFANTIFEPIWNRNYIDHVQITIAESVGVEHRASYYEHSGAIRDMFQNHMLQMLALATMEPPTSFRADSIRDEKLKLLESIRPFAVKDGRVENFLRARYGRAIVGGTEAKGYCDEEGVSEDSITETYVAAEVYIDNWRWKDVPFYLRTGKRLKSKLTEIAITFRQVPHSMFASVGLDELPANVLVMKIQPDEGMNLSFQAKRPGSKTCMSTLTMDFNYAELFGMDMPEAYQRLLLDCMVGDQTLFDRQDAVKKAWELITPVLDGWKGSGEGLCEYPAGCESFREADELIEKSGRKWRPLSQ